MKLGYLCLLNKLLIWSLHSQEMMIVSCQRYISTCENTLDALLKKSSLVALFEYDQCPLIFRWIRAMGSFVFHIPSLIPHWLVQLIVLFQSYFPFIHLEPNSIIDNSKTFRHFNMRTFVQCCSSQRNDFCHFPQMNSF